MLSISHVKMFFVPTIRNQGEYEMSTRCVHVYCVLIMLTLAKLLTVPTYFDRFLWNLDERILE